MKTRFNILLLCVCAAMLLLYSCRKPDLNDTSNINEWLSGGTQTVFSQNGGAFSEGFPNMSADKVQIRATGNLCFDGSFVSSPAPVNPGLGPLFNNVGCQSCHISDGRGQPPAPGQPLLSMLFRLSVPGTDQYGGPLPAPGYGGQLQTQGIAGTVPEGNVNISYTTQSYSFPDGTTYELLTPVYQLTSPYCPVPAGMMMSPRIAPPVFGLGLLETVSEATILQFADANDANHDGIKGVPNYVFDVQSQSMMLGRFGRKAEQTTILQQSAAAFNQDMGITNFVFPQENCVGQTQCPTTTVKGTDLSDSLMYAVAFYIRTTAVPARRSADDATVLHGKQLFTQAKCAACHRPMMTTGTNEAFPEISNQTIFPYTDLLLHDMGPALTDNRPVYQATAQQWRTTPLWGIGLTQIVNGNSYFLHDGRARNLVEAIMWHGGEAEQSKEFVQQLSTADRNALIAFLQSL